MNTKGTIILIIILAVAAFGVWWSSQSTTETPPTNNGSEQEFVAGTASVDTIDIAILESFPVQVRVTARGNLADGCTNVDQTNIERSGTTFDVSITTKRPKDAICTQALVPFEETMSLPVEGLAKGTYTVNVNGATDTFELQMDNSLENTE